MNKKGNRDSKNPHPAKGDRHIASTRPILIYLGIVGGFCLFSVVLVCVDFFDKNTSLLWGLYIYSLPITLGSVLASGSGSASWIPVLVGCLVYFGIGFLPLLAALRSKKNVTRTICIAVQVLLVILHFGIHFYLVALISAVGHHPG